jgi:hypothetical protein
VPGVAAAMLVVAGCSGANKAYPVKGMVSLDGQPATELAGGTVTFNSTQLHQSASSSIRPDGTYELSAAPGKYQVSVSPPETPPVSERGRPANAPKVVQFESPKNLEVTVERRANDIPITLHRKQGGRR